MNPFIEHLPKFNANWQPNATLIFFHPGLGPISAGFATTSMILEIAILPTHSSDSYKYPVHHFIYDSNFWIQCQVTKKSSIGNLNIVDKITHEID